MKNLDVSEFGLVDEGNWGLHSYDVVNWFKWGKFGLMTF